MNDKPKRGRPSTYTAEVASEICSRLAEGESLLGICRDDHMPSESTVRSWALDDREGFFAMYTRARTIQAHRMFEETLEIADDSRGDIRVDEDGRELTDYEVIQRSRLRVDTRKWYLSKVLPKLYGDRTQIELSGPDGGPIETAEMTDEQLRARAASLANRVGHLVGANGNGPKPGANGGSPNGNGKH